MLAQNFKTAAELKITEQLHSALITVLGMMERGEITDHEFHMGNWCGTACCIYGWARRVDRRLPGSPIYCETNPLRHGEVRPGSAYYQIFVPLAAPSLADIPVEKGAQALRSYLTTGKADWS